MLAISSLLVNSTKYTSILLNIVACPAYPETFIRAIYCTVSTTFPCHIPVPINLGSGVWRASPAFSNIVLCRLLIWEQWHIYQGCSANRKCNGKSELDSRCDFFFTHLQFANCAAIRALVCLTPHPKYLGQFGGANKRRKGKIMKGEGRRALGVALPVDVGARRPCVEVN